MNKSRSNGNGHADPAEKGAAPQDEQAENMPLFYKRPVPLHPERHAQAGLRPHQGYDYAHGTNAIVLAGSEFALAARHYPIVFSSATPAVPFAIVGFREMENLFIGADGNWHEGSYIPAYVRRYPFVCVKDAQSQRLILCVDEASGRFDAQAGAAFFADGKPTATTQEMMRFCETFQTHYEDTLKFTEWLEQNELLEERVASGKLDDGEAFTLRGFRLISTEKLQALDEEKILHLHRKGWLPLLHFHMQSLNNWGALGRFARRENTRAAA